MNRVHKMNTKSLILCFLTPMLLCLSGCAHPRYVQWDAAPGLEEKAYVEFYSSEPVRGLGFGKEMDSSIFLKLTPEKRTFLGHVGNKVEPRLRVAIPPGDHSFDCVPVMFHTRGTNVTVNAIPNQIVRVNVNSTDSPAAQFAIGILGIAATCRTAATVEAPVPVNLNDYAWKTKLLPGR